MAVTCASTASTLPELTTAPAGVKHKEQGISLGTLVGSNIANPLVAVGDGTLIFTYAVPEPLIGWDLPWETLTGALLWIILWSKKGKLGKSEGVYLMAIYFCYLIFRSALFPMDF